MVLGTWSNDLPNHSLRYKPIHNAGMQLTIESLGMAKFTGDFLTIWL